MIADGITSFDGTPPFDGTIPVSERPPVADVDEALAAAFARARARIDEEYGPLSWRDVDEEPTRSHARSGGERATRASRSAGRTWNLADEDVRGVVGLVAAALAETGYTSVVDASTDVTTSVAIYNETDGGKVTILKETGGALSMRYRTGPLPTSQRPA